MNQAVIARPGPEPRSILGVRVHFDGHPADTGRLLHTRVGRSLERGRSIAGVVTDIASARAFGDWTYLIGESPQGPVSHRSGNHHEGDQDVAQRTRSRRRTSGRQSQDRRARLGRPRDLPTDQDPPEAVLFAYTVGLTEAGLPELFVSGLPYQTAHVVMNKTARIALARQTELAEGDQIPERWTGDLERYCGDGDSCGGGR